MVRASSTPLGIALATFAAGPVFVATGVAASLYLQLPHPIIIRPSDLLLIVPAALLALIGGCVLALVPNIIGASLLVRAGQAFRPARRPEVWTITGGLAGVGIAAAAGAFQSPPTAFALIATSAVCAWLCRRPIVWNEDPEANP